MTALLSPSEASSSTINNFDPSLLFKNPQLIAEVVAETTETSEQYTTYHLIKQLAIQATTDSNYLLHDAPKEISTEGQGFSCTLTEHIYGITKIHATQLNSQMLLKMYNHVFSNTAKETSIPGYRLGKAPKEMYESIARGKIRTRFTQELIEMVYSAGLQKKSNEPLEGKNLYFSLVGSPAPTSKGFSFPEEIVLFIRKPMEGADEALLQLQTAFQNLEMPALPTLSSDEINEFSSVYLHSLLNTFSMLEDTAKASLDSTSTQLDKSNWVYLSLNSFSLVRLLPIVRYPRVFSFPLDATDAQCPLNEQGVEFFIALMDSRYANWKKLFDQNGSDASPAQYSLNEFIASPYNAMDPLFFQKEHFKPNCKLFLNFLNASMCFSISPSKPKTQLEIDALSEMIYLTELFKGQYLAKEEISDRTLYAQNSWEKIRNSLPTDPVAQYPILMERALEAIKETLPSMVQVIELFKSIESIFQNITQKTNWLPYPTNISSWIPISHYANREDVHTAISYALSHSILHHYQAANHLGSWLHFSSHFINTQTFRDWLSTPSTTDLQKLFFSIRQSLSLSLYLDAQTDDSGMQIDYPKFQTSVQFDPKDQASHLIMQFIQKESYFLTSLFFALDTCKNNPRG